MRSFFIMMALAAMAVMPIKQAQTQDTKQYWIKLKATDKFQRSLIANSGLSIEYVGDDYVIAIGSVDETKQVEKMGLVETSFALVDGMDFPPADADYHNYTEMKTALTEMAQKGQGFVQMISIGKSIEGRDMLGLRISGQLSRASELPGIFFMGGHHAREHLSVEMPLRFAKYLIDEYLNGNPRIKNLVDNRDIHIVPAINPDGLEWDIAGNRYKYWRKNRRLNANGTYGVDLNRNYGYQWGTGGSSTNPSSDVYMGPQPFSEPETQAVKNYVESNENITTLLSFHTFSQLILYPWGYSYDGIAKLRDRQVHETMAKQMATWNGYTPQQASELYIASGDTTDWAYGVHGIISFTFELDPNNSGFGPGGFYPGARIIPEVIRKNTEPCLYLIEYADNPYRVLEGQKVEKTRPPGLAYIQ